MHSDARASKAVLVYEICPALYRMGPFALALTRATVRHFERSQNSSDTGPGPTQSEDVNTYKTFSARQETLVSCLNEQKRHHKLPSMPGR